MPKFAVKRPIEHNLRLYLPKAGGDAASQRTPATAFSAGHGGEIPVDASGVIEVSEKDTAPLFEVNAIEELPARKAKAEADEEEDKKAKKAKPAKPAEKK